jgi:large subunit ribosomal protein L14
MIQTQSLLKVIDNSGAKSVKCIKILGGFKRKYAILGNIIVVSVQQLRNKAKISSKVKKGEIYKAVILRTKRKIWRKDGFNFIFHQNSVALLNKQNKPIATRIFGKIPRELRTNKFIKLASLSLGFF